MKVVNIREAKTQLSALVRDVRAGNESEIVIALRGKPAAKLAPIGKTAPPPLGLDRGLIAIEANFDAVDPHIAKIFDGNYGD